VPGVVDAFVVTVTVEPAPLAVGIMLAGFAVQVDPSPKYREQLIATVPVKPLPVVPLMVNFAEFPTFTVWLPGLAANLKLDVTCPVLSKMVKRLLLTEPAEPTPLAAAKSGLPSPFRSPAAMKLPYSDAAG
jgi:hypothetical protein